MGRRLRSALTLGAARRGAPAAYIGFSALAVAEDTAVGGLVATLAVSNGSGEYVFAIEEDLDGKFAIDGNRLELGAAVDYETKRYHDVTVSADNGVDDVISRTRRISVTNVLEGATLVDLSLDDATVTEGEAVTINIIGTATGSTLTVVSGALPGGMTLNSGARTITGTPTIGTFAFTLRETLADSPNSPLDTPLSITVEAGSGEWPVPEEPDPALNAPSLALAVAADEFPIELDIDTDETHEEGMRVRVRVSTTWNFAPGTWTDHVAVITEADATAGTITLGLSEYTSGVHFMKAWIESDIGYSPVSNAIGHGDTEAPTATLGTVNRTENAPLYVAVDFDEPCYASLTGPDAGLLELYGAQPAESIVVRLIGDADLDFETRDNLLFSVVPADITGNVGDPLICDIDVINDPSDDPVTIEWASADGADKNAYVTPSGTPKLTITGTAGVGAACMVRAIGPSPGTGLRTFRMLMNSAGNVRHIGLDNKVPNLSGFGIPNSADAIVLTIAGDGANWGIYHNGSLNQSGSDGAAGTTGDTIIVEFNKETRSVAFKRDRGGTVTAIGSAVTVPAWTNFYAIAGLNWDDSMTADFTGY